MTVMLMGMALLPLVARLLLLFFGVGMGAILETVAGCGARTGIAIDGAEGLGIGSSQVRQQHFQWQMPMVKMQMAAPIMAAGEVNAQCKFGVLSWSS
jgi:hypothetical protein